MRILYIDLDALTPSHLSCYGYHRNTSPTIDGIAAEGVRCNNVYTTDAPCLPSRTAFYSGRFGIQTGVVGHGGTAAQPKIEGADRGFRDHFDAQGFATQLQHAGFHTAMISPFGQRHAAHHFYAGFNEIHNTGKGGMEAVSDVNPVVEKWLSDNAANDNWYLHLNYWDIHTPYRTPLDYGDPFADEPLPDFLTDDVIARHVRKTGPHTAQDFGMYVGDTNPDLPRQPGSMTDREGIRQCIDGYDTAIKYVDDQIKWMCDRLKAAGVYEDTAIIIAADHGENLGELGIYGEHGTADEATCNIPFIVKWPGAKAGHVDDGLHYHLDWAPTVMELLGREDLTEQCPLWDGQSYASALMDGADAGRDELIISQCCHVCQRSVRYDKWLYIRSYHDGFHLFPREMLFDLESDPHEQNNVAEEHPDICREATYRLDQWHERQMLKMAENASDVVDPLWTVIREGGPFHANAVDGRGQPPKLTTYVERLKATGRAEGAKRLQERIETGELVG
jgi:choline-sulfatase